MSACGHSSALLSTIAAGDATDVGDVVDRCGACRAWLAEVRARAAALGGADRLQGCDQAEVVLAALDLDDAPLDDIARLFAHLVDCEACREASSYGIEEWLEGHAHAAPPRAPSAAPVIVPRSAYEPIGEIGRGGMGRVWRARDRRLGREVAVKEMLVDDGGWDAQRALRARFEREARLTARLEHPSIVGVHEAGEWSTGEPFYAMRLVTGDPLDALIARTPAARERLALLPHLIDAAEAIAYAHSRRVCHRDLKPGNILIGAFGETVVIDWGLARDLGEPAPPELDDGPYRRASGTVTVQGQVIGTPAFMPPEQARGEPADERFDVHALGAILYHLLAGAPPYRDTGARDPDAIVTRVLAGPPTPLRELAPRAPEELLAIADKAMARDPEQRYRTAQALAEDLRRYQAGQLVSAHRYSPLELATRWLRRRRVPIAAAGALAIALVATGALSVVRIVRERDRAAAASAVAHERNQELLLTHAERALDRDPTESLAWLAQLSLDDPAHERRAREIAAEAVALGVADAIVPGSGSPITQLAVTMDGTRIATADSAATLRLWDPDTLESTELAHGVGHNVWHLAFSPDGSLLGIAGSSGVELIELATAERTRLRVHEGDAYAVNFTPDGAAVITSGADGLVQRVELPSLSVRTLARFANGAIAIYDPDRPLIAVYTMGHELGVIDPARGLLWRAEQTPRATDARVAPDGSWIVTTNADGAVVRWDARRGARRELARTKGTQRVVVVNDGDVIITGVRSEAAWRIDVATGEAAVIAPTVDGAEDLSRTADDWVAFGLGNGRIRARHEPTQREVELRGHDKGDIRVAILPDELAVTFGAREVRRWHLTSGLRRVYRGHTAAAWEVGYRRDGVLVTTGRDGSVRAWPAGAILARDVPGGASKLSPTLTGTFLRGYLGACLVATGAGVTALGPRDVCARGFAPSPDGQRVAAVGSSTAVRVWNLGADAPNERLLDDGELDTVAVAFASSDRLRGATSAGVVEWDLRRRERRTLARMGSKTPRAVWSPTGQTVVASTDRGVMVWPGTGAARVLPELPTTASARYAVTDDGSRAVAWDGHRIAVRDIHGARSHALELPAPVSNAAISADGSFLAIASTSDVIVWHPDAGELLALDTHGPWATHVAISPDGTRFAVATDAGAAIEWTLERSGGPSGRLGTWLRDATSRTAAHSVVDATTTRRRL